MIENVIKNWHSFVNGELPNALDEILADKVVFYSPVVFNPQEGKVITKAYLTAASATFNEAGNFCYTKEILSENNAVLEFEVKLDGIYVNGVDIITCNEQGQITEFKVMVRPLQAVNVLHQKMKQMLNNTQ